MTSVTPQSPDRASSKSGPTSIFTPDGTPCWDAITEESHCPLCNYNLRGLSEPRCPECGYTFQWRNLLDPALRLHPYIFEHHPKSNVRSLIRTVRAGWRPKKFWTSLHPAQPSRPGRLILYWLINALWLILPISFIIAILTVDASRATAAARARLTSYFANRATAESIERIVAGYGSIQNYLDQQYPKSTTVILGQVLKYEDVRTGSVLFLALCLSWPWVTLLSLLVFQASMRRRKIRPVHILRCVTYASDVLCIGVIVFSLHFLGNFFIGASALNPEPIFVLATFLTMLSLVVLGSIRLTSAY